MNHPATQTPAWKTGRTFGGRAGSAIVAVLCVTALLSLLLLSLLHGVRLERVMSSTSAAAEQARLATESGTAAALSLLSLATSDHPAYLVGLTNGEDAADTLPAVVIGATNLTSPQQLLPLFSFDLKSAIPFPKLPPELLENLLTKRRSTNPAVTVDLNNPSLAGHPAGETESPGGLVAPSGRCPVIWQSLHDTAGKTVARYAFVLTDESARLNPLLHRGEPRTDASDWHRGPEDLPLTNGTASLMTGEEAAQLPEAAAAVPTEGGFEAAFTDAADYARKRFLLTRDPCPVPDLIPATLPEGGLPKYNLNDLATNPAWGATPYARAEKIAAVIDRNLPKFKLRDPSLSGKGADQTLYLRRLACSIVDYISSEPGPTGPPGGEPSGRDLFPMVTQIAECCTRTALTDTSVTIETRLYAELWNPYTNVIPAGGIPRLLVGNRARLEFGTGLSTPFSEYDQSASPLPALGPNEFTVVAFPPVEQTWTTPEPTTLPPHWSSGPSGNADTLHHQTFEFFWNGRRVDMSRRPPFSPGDAWGGLSHLGQTLHDATPRWQCLTIPTWSSTSDGRDQADEAEEAVQPGNYRFVGDPRATFLTSYKWCVATNYPAKTLWKGVSPAGILGRGFVMDPVNTWMRRDTVPVNPVRGSPPPSERTPPELIPSPYRPDGSGTEAPFVLRKGTMRSLGELGNIFDPAQADDLGQAPLAGSPKNRFCCGGGRTLRVGQPEFHVADPASDWDVPGKRAVELLDLFTLADSGRRPDGETASNPAASNAGVPGRVNVNTAPHAVLTALFSGLAVTSDRRFTNSTIGARAADELASLVEQKRPYERLSDLRVLTPKLANADTYAPALSKNTPGSSPPLADVFDRAREEAFGKVIGHCVVQSRAFRLLVLGESLDPSGKPSARRVMEGIVHLTEDASGRLAPSLHDVRWY